MMTNGKIKPKITLKNKKALACLVFLLLLSVSSISVSAVSSSLVFSSDLHWVMVAYGTDISFSSDLACDSFSYDDANSTEWVWYGTAHWSSFGLSSENANVTVTDLYTVASEIKMTITNTSSDLATVKVIAAGHQPSSVTKDGVALVSVPPSSTIDGYYYSGDDTYVLLSPTGSPVALVLNFALDPITTYTFSAFTMISVIPIILAAAALLLSLMTGELQKELIIASMIAGVMIIVGLGIIVAFT